MEIQFSRSFRSNSDQKTKLRDDTKNKTPQQQNKEQSYLLEQRIEFIIGKEREEEMIYYDLREQAGWQTTIVFDLNCSRG